MAPISNKVVSYQITALHEFEVVPTQDEYNRPQR